MTRKSTLILNRISRIFHHPSSTATDNNPPAITTTTSTIHNNTSLLVLLERAPSSKLLIDDISSLEYSYSCSDIHQHQDKEPNSRRKSWASTLSKLKTIKHYKKKLPQRNKSQCCFITQQQGAEATEVSTSDQQPQQQGVIVEEEKSISNSPLSITSSLNSTATKLHFLSSTSSWSPIQETSGLSTARTSIDSQHLSTKDVVDNSIHLAENVKKILGDAIYLADQELDI